jgi:N-methylhydantoinase A
LLTEEGHTSAERISGFVCGVDIGGTFTDCVLVDARGQVALGKALSSPDDGYQSGFFGAIEAAAHQLGVSTEDLYGELGSISHGSTVATNIVAERAGARIGLITTRGFEDTVRIMRGMGRATGEPPENLLRVAQTAKPEPLVSLEHVRGVTERVDCDGDVVVALNQIEVRNAAQALIAAGVETIAIAFLWSVRNPTHEHRAREIVRELAPELFITISSDISKAVGEYERFVATLINAYVGPVTSSYLHAVHDRLQEVGFAGDLHLMQCHGGMVPWQSSVDRPVLTIGSGPVGGLIGCARVAVEVGKRDLIASDMGGTTFDVGIVKDGEPLAAEDTLVGKFRYRVPAIEVTSIGAGGSSVAWADKHGGGLRVGPRSAGSRPGPACYGRGGQEPTVTDADLVLGYIDAEARFGTGTGSFTPRRDLAEQAIRERIAAPLGLSLHDAALGIVEVTNAKMANLLENGIIGRGFDPRDFALMSYGGAGPLHAVGYAATMGIDTILVPGEVASVWSAFGISQADIRYQYESAAVFLEPFSPGELEAAFGELEATALAAMSASESVDRFEFRRYVRMQFQWQLHELEWRLPDGGFTEEQLASSCRDFIAMYGQRYGEAALLPGATLQITGLRLEPAMLRGSARLERFRLRQDTALEQGRRQVWFTRGEGPLDTPTFNGDAMPAGHVLHGPAVIDLAVTGIVLPPGSSCERRASGDFLVTLNGALAS